MMGKNGDGKILGAHLIEGQVHKQEPSSTMSSNTQLLRTNVLSSTAFLTGAVLWFLSYVIALRDSSVFYISFAGAGFGFMILHAIMELSIDYKHVSRPVFHNRYGGTRGQNVMQSLCVLLAALLEVAYFVSSVVNTGVDSEIFDWLYFIAAHLWFVSGIIICCGVADSTGFDRIANVLYGLATLAALWSGYELLTDPNVFFGEFLKWAAIFVWCIVGCLYVFSDSIKSRRGSSSAVDQSGLMSAQPPSQRGSGQSAGASRLPTRLPTAAAEV